MNLTLAAHVLQKLLDAGVKHFVICPGSFNSPFVALLQSSIPESLSFHFEERSAAFFALGKAKYLKAPVVVCVTSGTAVAECLPAVVEARYANQSLIVLSGDRQRSLSGTGYPQAIIQTELLVSHCHERFDIENEEHADGIRISEKFPTHINVRFCEPILSCKNVGLPQLYPPRGKMTESKPLARPAMRTTETFLKDKRSPLVIVENIDTTQQQAVTEFLKKLGAPIIAEARSGLHCSAESSDLILRSYDALLSPTMFDSVIRIGSVPATSLWRDLERHEQWRQLPVLSLTSIPGSGLSRETTCEVLAEQHLEVPAGWRAPLLPKRFFEADKIFCDEIKKLFTKFPSAEPSFVHGFARSISEKDFLYLGNSLAIRHWNRFCGRKVGRVEANRGANGIDGQIATFLGLLGEERASYCILGDLTALYDVSSLSMVRNLPPRNLTLAVIQNYGGRIFEELPYLPDFFGETENRNRFLGVHGQSFSALATAFGIVSQQVRSASEIPHSTGIRCLEFLVDPEQDAAFRDQAKAFQTHFRALAS